MKIFSLVVSILLTVLILILAFENIQAACSGLNFLFWSVADDTSPTILVLGTTFFGILTGAFYGAFFRSMMANDEDEEAF